MNANINIPVLDNDSDPDDPIVNIDSITTQPTNGTAGIRPDGTIIYKPNTNYVGEDSFTYKICDTSNECDEATVSVTVEPPPNKPPIANDDFVTISENMNPGPQIPVLTNDNDGDGDELIVTNVEEPNNGNVEISQDEKGVVYTPDEGFTGVDCKFFALLDLTWVYIFICTLAQFTSNDLLHVPKSIYIAFEYTTCDPSNECDTAIVTVTVDPSNNDPIVFDDRENTPAGEPLVIDVLTNDIPDVGLEVTEVTSPSNGTCEITANGQVEYTPKEGFFGQDECTCKFLYCCELLSLFKQVYKRC